MKLITGTQLRFGIVGIANTLVDALGYALLFSAGVPLFVANFISTSAGMLLSFTLNRNFTFRSREGSVRKQILLFFAVTAFGLWVVQALVIFAVTKAFPGVHVLVPKFAGIAVGLVWNYLLYNKIVFRQTAPLAPAEPAREVSHD
ncbi:GtrA family protein [Amycolatopsis sp. H20-H5]|uniref:GtrA family protein n=1 Tax=Amycolatopsis sp. H20-H5 TaxID=3046309 RepID=UPI002DB82DA9|nr:GtrA family protein [Amycolatopsis sp. H20-H5]MEC3980191.1 GtrA family protein [Amycolatopsis sp. H20-H5]